jgi:hypothetical protein
MNLERLRHLAHKIFIGTPDGKEFLKLLKEYEESIPVFPVDPSVIAKHGSSAGWANYRAGSKYLIGYIVDMINDYDAKMVAINKGKLKNESI